MLNNIDLNHLKQTAEAINNDPDKGFVSFAVNTRWAGQCRTQSRPKEMVIDGEVIPRNFLIESDEPEALLGKDTAANPQELLLSALNACMSVGYVTGAAMKGITLTKLEITAKGTLDLRGFLGLDANVKAGYDSLEYEVTIEGDGSKAQFEEIHQNVLKTSPNRFNIAMPVRLEGKLTVL
ncbi:OsmC family protein [Thalassomonas viridans]|uniref:OsmC family protein n=1 Tax=Thalassomonas viridans TaxID=137584 RepID=A0AAF0CD49_9GAMM|nr:OsmC family protein [Thalassomonas viridans]WDE08863.1 OsmC family protein [Thalassomonas viridans]